jgi:hypothetical protein
VIILMFENVHDQASISLFSVPLIEANDELFPPEVVESTVSGRSKREVGWRCQ